MHFTVEAQNLAKPYLTAGSIAIDATCGNGFDTLFLADQVGGSGIVYGVDIQARAIETVRVKLLEAGTLQQCRLIAGSHSQLKSMIEQEHLGVVSAVMFNLGYLPLGDKTIVTKPETTLEALDQALEMLRVGGLLSVLAYPGHPGGQEESQCVADWIARHTDELHAKRFQDPKNDNSPILWSLTKIAGA